MREGEDFGHRIRRYQRYPTGFTGVRGYPNRLRIRGFTFAVTRDTPPISPVRPKGVGVQYDEADRG